MTITQSELNQFIGTEHYYNYPIMGMKFYLTDGIKYMAEKCNAYWLLNEIFLSQIDEIEHYPFQIWKLEKKDDQFVLTMKTDSDQPVLVRKVIKESDFPLDSFKCYLIDDVLILPSEH